MSFPEADITSADESVTGTFDSWHACVSSNALIDARLFDFDVGRVDTNDSLGQFLAFMPEHQNK
jgi:hypothetical protein